MNNGNIDRKRSRSKLKEAERNVNYISNRNNSRKKSVSKNQYYSNNNNNAIYYRDYVNQYKEANNIDLIDRYNYKDYVKPKKENVKIVRRERVSSVNVQRNEPRNCYNYAAKPVWWG